MRKKYIEKEWQQLLKQEENFLNRNVKVKQSNWQEKIDRFVPEKLSDTLNAAFFKAFEMIFDKGTGIIEKTYQKEKKVQDYKINEYTAEVRGSRRALKAFGRKAKTSKNFNMAVSTVEGIGMGVLGMGLPDIPVFLGVLLRSIYEIAVSYGFSYDTEEEQIFILKIIETALSHENELMQGNMDLNLWMERKNREKTSEEVDTAESDDFSISRSEQIRHTSDALSRELLYLKFIQGIPVVGVVGGVSDMVYQKRISDYAVLKYKRRFLVKKKSRIKFFIMLCLDT